MLLEELVQVGPGGFSMKPHLVFYLAVDPSELVHRVFHYESGAADNMFKSFRYKCFFLLIRELNIVFS
jgi:hypothetical protein